LETKLTLEFEKNNRLHEQLKAERSMWLHATWPTYFFLQLVQKFNVWLHNVQLPRRFKWENFQSCKYCITNFIKALSHACYFLLCRFATWTSYAKAASNQAL
jgi:hypothetical protein